MSVSFFSQLMLLLVVSTQFAGLFERFTVCLTVAAVDPVFQPVLSFPAVIVHFSCLLLWFACESICLGQSPSFSPSLLRSPVHFVTACPLHHFHLSAPLFGSLSLYSEERVRLETTTTHAHTKHNTYQKAFHKCTKNLL